MSKVFAKQLQIAIEKKELSKSKIASDFINVFGIATKNAKITKPSAAIKDCINALLKKGVKMSTSFRDHLELLLNKTPEPVEQPKPIKEKGKGEW